MLRVEVQSVLVKDAEREDLSTPPARTGTRAIGAAAALDGQLQGGGGGGSPRPMVAAEPCSPTVRPAADAATPERHAQPPPELPADKAQFMESLEDFMAERGTPMTKVPTLGHKELDLFILYCEVVKRGGVEAVIAAKLWRSVADTLDLPSTCTDSGFRLRRHYLNYLFPYERKFFLMQEDDVDLPRAPRRKATRKRGRAQEKAGGASSGVRKRRYSAFAAGLQLERRKSLGLQTRLFAGSGGKVVLGALDFASLQRYQTFHCLADIHGEENADILAQCEQHFESQLPPREDQLIFKFLSSINDNSSEEDFGDDY